MQPWEKQIQDILNNPSKPDGKEHDINGGESLLDYLANPSNSGDNPRQSEMVIPADKHITPRGINIILPNLSGKKMDESRLKLMGETLDTLCDIACNYQPDLLQHLTSPKVFMEGIGMAIDAAQPEVRKMLAEIVIDYERSGDKVSSIMWLNQPNISILGINTLLLYDKSMQEKDYHYAALLATEQKLGKQLRKCAFGALVGQERENIRLGKDSLWRKNSENFKFYREQMEEHYHYSIFGREEQILAGAYAHALYTEKKPNEALKVALQAELMGEYVPSFGFLKRVQYGLRSLIGR
jgi:hypothetical protein